MLITKGPNIISLFFIIFLLFICVIILNKLLVRVNFLESISVKNRTFEFGAKSLNNSTVIYNNIFLTISLLFLIFDAELFIFFIYFSSKGLHNNYLIVLIIFTILLLFCVLIEIKSGIFTWKF